MIQEEQPIPTVVRDLVEMGRLMVEKVFGVGPDYTPETLPLVDQYLRQVPLDASDEVRALALSAVGAYFGEVVRRTLHGNWGRVADMPPELWRIELTSCYLHFLPVGMAGEVLAGGKTDEYDGSFATLDELQEDLSELLAHIPPVAEEEYYSLSGRIDVLQLVADWLTAQRLATGEPVDPFTTEDYAQRLDV